MMGRPKFKDSWIIQPDNSNMVVQPSNQQIYRQNQFITNDWHQHCSQFYSLIKYLASPFARNTVILLVETETQLHQCINLMLNDQYAIVQIYSEYGASYKGFISWMLLANSNHCFLIDCITLRNSLDTTRKIFQDTRIVKLVYEWYEVSKSLKRDFGIFIVNIFDLVCLELQYESLTDIGIQMRKSLHEQLMEVCNIIIQRPIQPRMWKLINHNFKVLLQYSLKMSKNPTSKSQSESRYLQHILYKYQQCNQPSFGLQLYHHESQKTLSKEEQDELNPRIYKLYYSLISFRQHVAKMNDISVNRILPKLVIDKILQNSKISVLQISQLYENSNCQKISLELCKRIYDVIQLNEQLHEDSQKLNKQLFQKQLSCKKQNVQPSIGIKKLLKDIQWGDSSEWLNRKDDPSIKLYKQIISIEEFDHSIGQEYLASMKGDVLKKRDLGKYLKYAEYMRNKNYQKLQNLYKMNQLIKQSNKQDQFSQQTQCETKASNQQFGRKLFDQQCQYQKAKSSTSLQQKLQKRMQQISQDRIKSAFMKNESSKQMHNIEQSSQNSKSRRSSESGSIESLSQIDEICIKRSDIKPLPDSIQQIYQMALQVKKKVEKKTNKKKQKKGKGDNTKQTEFIPTWDDIQKLINYATNYK